MSTLHPKPALDQLLANYRLLPPDAHLQTPDVWDGHNRVVTVLNGSSPVMQFAGSSGSIEERATALHGNGWRAIQDTSNLSGPQPLPPDLLQHRRVWRRDFTADRPRFNGRTADMVVALGLHTYADILALGTRAILTQATAARINMEAQHIGLIAATTFRETGHRLGEEQTEPAGLRRFYADVTEASPAIALPFGPYRQYGHLGIDAKNRETIRSLRNASAFVLGRYAVNSLGDGKLLLTFVDQHLSERVIEPFVRRMAPSRVPRQR